MLDDTPTPPHLQALYAERARPMARWWAPPRPVVDTPEEIARRRRLAREMARMEVHPYRHLKAV